MNDPPTALVGFETSVHSCFCRLSMNDPPTALVGFETSVHSCFCRLCMNDPPTPLVGFETSVLSCFCRLSMNDPLTALVGFGNAALGSAKAESSPLEAQTLTLSKNASPDSPCFTSRNIRRLPLGTGGVFTRCSTM